MDNTTFTDANTEGFTANQLAWANAEYEKRARSAGLPLVAEHGDDDVSTLLNDIKDRVLNVACDI
jgi:hypothetical protein